MGLRLVESHSFSTSWKNFTGHFVHIEQFDIFSLFTRNLEWLGVYSNGGSVSRKHRISRSLNQSEIRPVPCNVLCKRSLHRRLNLQVILLLVNSAFYCVFAYDASGYQLLLGVESVVKSGLDFMKVGDPR